MSVYAIGDTHLSFSVDKPMDIFKGWDDYAQRLEKNWQKLITKDDNVIINGDVSWAMSLEEVEHDFEFLNNLNGTKIISKGNHDYWWNTVTKMEKYCKEKGIKTYDQFGTIGDLSKDNPRLGLHEFKKKFGGDYVEFVGEWDYITNPLMYFVFTKLVPIYRNIIRRKSKKELQNEVKKTI